jgi:hypothetical protein
MRMSVASMSGVLEAQQQIIGMQADVIRQMRTREQAREDVPAEDRDNPEAVAKAEALTKLGNAFADEVIPRVARYVDSLPIPGMQGQEN